MTDGPASLYKTQLRRAYGLIRGGRKAEAFELLTPILAQQTDDIDAWWLAVFAAPSPQKAVFACQRVLTLKPDHWPAQQMLAEQQRLLAAQRMRPTQDVDPDEPIPLKPAQIERSRMKTWQLLGILAVPLIIIGVLIAFITITGNTLGLPIGGMFSQRFKLEGLQVITGNSLTDTVVVRREAMVSGAVHEYVFAGTRFANFSAQIEFELGSPPLTPDVFVLLTGSGTLVAEGDSTGFLNVLLPADGEYILRITGKAGVSQGPYSLMAAFFPVPATSTPSRP